LAIIKDWILLFQNIIDKVHHPVPLGVPEVLVDEGIDRGLVKGFTLCNVRLGLAQLG